MKNLQENKLNAEVVLKGDNMEVVEMKRLEEMVENAIIESVIELAMDFDDDDFDFDLDDDFDLDEEDELEEEVKPEPKKVAKATPKKEEIVEEEEEEDLDLEEDDFDLGDDFDIDEEDEEIVEEPVVEDEEEVLDIEDEDEEEVLDIEDEEVLDIEDEEVKPEPKKVAKTKVSKTTKKVSDPKKATTKTTSKKATTKTTTKKSNGGLGFKTATQAAPTMTYQDMLDEIKVKKVDSYNAIMEARAAGKSKQVPGNKRINKSDFVRLISLKSKESELVQKAMVNFLRQLGIEIPAEMRDEVLAKCNFNLAQSKALYEELFVDVVYDLVSIGSGLEFIDKEDCKFSFAGERIEEKVIDNSKLASIVNSETNATLVQDYIKVTSSSKAPEGRKVKGNLVKGKFVPVKGNK